MTMPLETYLMTVALAVRSRSTCRTQVGCVLADRKGRILATGYNGPPSGVPHCNERGCKQHKCGTPPGCEHSCLPGKCDSVHAEQNALLQCREPDSVHFIVITRAPCLSCLRQLMNSGGKVILFNEPSSYNEVEEYWKRHRGDFLCSGIPVWEADGWNGKEGTHVFSTWQQVKGELP